MLNAAPPPSAVTCHELKTERVLKSEKHHCNYGYSRQPLYYYIYGILSLVSKQAFRDGQLVVIVSLSSLGTNYSLALVFYSTFVGGY